MAIKLTKNELKKQKDQLRQYERYLPTLQLKKQQLQMVIMQVESELRDKEAACARLRADIEQWADVFAENRALPNDRRVELLIRPGVVVCGEDNIAGVMIPVYRELTFHDEDYNVDDYPLWVDTAVLRLKELAQADAEMQVLRRQAELLNRELRATSQRVNLFEKVKIPETRENIRVISIYLGNEQTTAVVRGKIAKKKLQEANG